MRTFKKIVFVVLIIIVIFLVVAAIMPRNYEVEREIVIQKPQTEVFDYVVLLRNQDNFSVWAGMDPLMKKTFRGVDGTVGFVSAWESKDPNVGKGEQEITQIEPLKRIDYEMRFIEPFETKDQAFMIFDAVNDSSTKVVWGFSGTFPYPMNVMMPFMNMEEMLGKDFSQGLENLKSILEQKPSLN